MITNKINDERVLGQQRKIGSDAFVLVSTFLLVSVLYKQFVLNLPVSTYITELVAFLGGLFYVVLKNSLIGNDIINPFGPRKIVIKNYFISSLLKSFTIAIGIIIIDNGVLHDLRRLIISIVCIFAWLFLSSLGLSWLSKIRSDIITQQNEDQEDINL